MTPSVVTAADPLVAFDCVTLGYGGKPALSEITGAIGQGEMLALIGPNGAGKSTLLKALAGLHRPMSGRITKQCNSRPAYVPQQSAIDRAFPLSVEDFVAMGLWQEIGSWRSVGKRQRARIDAALALVGLQNFADQLVGTLSGGQLRRALFARASLQDAQLVLLDEPFAGIDATTATHLLGVIADWHMQGRTIVAAMHDLVQVRAVFPRTLLLGGRVVAWGDTASVLTNDSLTLAQALCAAEPSAINAASPHV